MAMLELRAHFRPEFLNRLDEIIMFKPLNKNDISSIINLLVDEINTRLVSKGISIDLSERAKDFIVENAYDPQYGARPLKRYLQKHVETLAAKIILQDDLHEKDIIFIDFDEISNALNAKVIHK